MYGWLLEDRGITARPSTLAITFTHKPLAEALGDTSNLAKYTRRRWKLYSIII